MNLYESAPATISINVQVTAVTMANDRGRWIRGYRASLGEYCGEGRTAKAAKDALAAQVTATMTREEGPVILTYGGYVTVISPLLGTRDGWELRTVAPDGQVGGSTFVDGTRADMTAQARYDLVQRATVWTDDASVHAGHAYLAEHPVNDDLFYGPAAFLNYAAWQRAAAQAIADGREDWHEWASRNRQDFAVA